MSEQKYVYRIEAKRHRERMDIRDEDPEKAAENFLAAVRPRPGQIVAAYWPKGREIDTSDLMHILHEEGFQIALPVIQRGSKVLKFALWQDNDDLVKGPYDILQPSINAKTRYVFPDIVIVPMLAFDRRGHRLGYGGGYYDATLDFLRKEKQVVAVGLAYSKQAVLFNLPAEDHDQPLDWVITPKDVHCYQSDAKESV